MAAQIKFQKFVLNLGKAAINWNTDSFKVALSNTAPNVSTNNTIADITQIANGNGYTTGGTAIGGTSYAQVAGVGKFVGNDVTFTAAGGSIGPFQYIVIYDVTSGNFLMTYVDLGVAVTITDTNSLVVDFDATNGIAQLS